MVRLHSGANFLQAGYVSNRIYNTLNNQISLSIEVGVPKF
jgi:hypothetical protein